MIIMTGINDLVWLTFALTDSDVPNALTLCFSLRRVWTSKRLGVIVSPKVSRELRETLNYGFDFVFTLEEDRNTAGLEAEDFVKLFALTFRCFRKCVMLSPNMLVVKNCDELLDGEREETSQQFTWTKDDDADLSVLSLKPSLRIFNYFMKTLAKWNGTGMDDFLKIWHNNQTPNCTFLDKKYNWCLFGHQETVVGNIEDMTIVNLKNKPECGVNSKEIGLIGERILELWTSIYTENVLPILEAVTNCILPEIESEHGRCITNAVAIVGMSCRYPGANNLDEFWQILLKGKDGTGNPPEFRWRKEQCRRQTPNCTKTNAGFLKCPVDDFDFKFFNISPKEMVCLDPQHRLLHELVWEGLEDAAIDPYSLEGTNGGVFIGSWLTDYKDILAHAGIEEFYRI